MRETNNGAFARLSDATRGFDVYVKNFIGPDGHDTLVSAANQPGVADVGGPWQNYVTDAGIAGATVQLRVQVRQPGLSPVDQPYVTEGSWLGNGAGVVLEDGLADVLDIHPGDTVTINGADLAVAGRAMSTSTQRYPLEAPALAWIDTTSSAMVFGEQPSQYEWMMLRLDDSATAALFASQLASSLPANGFEVHDAAERGAEEEAGSPVRDLGVTLLVIGTVLSALTTLTAALLIASRLAARRRQVGTLKAVGVTPLQLAATMLLESGTVAVIATVAGAVVGRLAAPRLADAVTTLYGGPQAPPFNPARLVIVASVALVLVAVATVRPSILAARQSTVRALASGATAPRRSRLGSLADRIGLPVTITLAIRSLTRRPSRLATNIATLTVAVAMAVLGISLRTNAEKLSASGGFSNDPGEDAVLRLANQAEYDQIVTVVLVGTTLLVALALVNTIVTAVFVARDSARTQAMTRAVGATPTQILTGALAAQLGSCLAACIVGVPLGRGLFNLWAGQLATSPWPITSTLVVASAACAVYATATLIPTRLIAAAPVTRALATE